MSELPEETKQLREKVYELMTELPADKVTTYGDLAALAGSPRAARIVGGIAHSGPTELPWHRLVNAQGGLAVGFPGGQDVQRQLLEQDGIECDEEWHIKDFGERRWRPEWNDPNEPPLVVIVGPTASGKTALAIKLACQHEGEIICADSRTIYKGMDIGTAKPSMDERARVPHWGLDLVEPGERFTAADFKQYALAAIAEIRARGHVPFLVGGTGLYVDAVLFDYQFGVEADPQLRAQLNDLSIDQLQEYCVKHSIELPENALNKRYLIRAIEQGGVNHKRNGTVAANTIVVGIATNKEALRCRIEDRTEQLFTNGVVDETKILGEKYGWDSEAMTGNIYPVVHSYLHGELTLEAAKQRASALDWRLAKRQLTWLRRNPYIEWLDREDAEHYIAAKLYDIQ